MNNVALQTASKRITISRARLILDQPFFGSLALKFELREDIAEETTCWTDGVYFGYNTDFIDVLNDAEVEGILCHEVLHCALLHHTRRNFRDPMMWNVACDYAINLILVSSGFTLPKGHLFNRRFEGLSAEQIYDILEKDADKKQKSQAKNGNGKGEGKGTGKGEGKGSEDESHNSESEAEETKNEDYSKAKNSTGEVRDYKESDSKPKSANEAEWKSSAVQALQQSTSCGKVPSSVKRMLEGQYVPKLNWKEILRQFIDKNIKDDYSWIKPNRRYIGQGLYLPSMNSNTIGKMVIAIDTSGSINNAMLKAFMEELNVMLSAYDFECHVLDCDCEIQGHVTYTQQDLPITHKPKGGGGTNFIPPFKWVMDNLDRSPSCLIYFTDGYCYDYPDTEPEYPVLWVSVGYDFDPPWGGFIKMRDAVGNNY